MSNVFLACLALCMLFGCIANCAYFWMIMQVRQSGKRVPFFRLTNSSLFEAYRELVRDGVESIWPLYWYRIGLLLCVAIFLGMFALKMGR